MSDIYADIPLPAGASVIILCSGGLDSITLLYYARLCEADIHLLHIIYGQRHAVETSCVRYHARKLNLPLHTVVLPIWTLEDTALVGSTGKIAHEEYQAKHMSTYVPARNTVFASIAMSYMERLKIRHLGMGIHETETYPDTSPHWADAMSHVMRVGMELSVFDRQDVGIWAPFVNRTKTDIVKQASAHQIPLQFTWSCYDPKIDLQQHNNVKWTPCFQCATCLDRIRAFRGAGVPDPLTHLTIRTSNKEDEIIIS